jgi:hypothetical protein
MLPSGKKKEFQAAPKKKLPKNYLRLFSFGIDLSL